MGGHDITFQKQKTPFEKDLNKKTRKMFTPSLCKKPDGRNVKNINIKH